MSAASVRPRAAADCLIRSALDISHPRQQGNLLQARLLSVALSAATLSMALVQVQSGGVTILRWFLSCLQASFPVLLTLLLPLRRRAVVNTCLRKVKHRITAPFRVPRLIVPPLALTVSTRKPMFLQMPPSYPGISTLPPPPSHRLSSFLCCCWGPSEIQEFSLS